MQPNFPQGKLPGLPEFTDTYFNMSQGDGEVRGSWNQGGDWVYVDSPEPAVDGGDGLATVTLPNKDAKVLSQMITRTMSDPSADPLTGADLGSGEAEK
jgi:Mn-containing catalase